VEWHEADLPDVGDDPAAWSWEISRPAELTRARQDLHARIGAQHLPDDAEADDVDRLLLTFEELASNGLRHGGAPIRVRVTGTADGWLVDVSDARPGLPPVPARERDPAQGGLGLHLVARLAARYGWTVVGARKHVWAALGRGGG
jgi:anti-sigma regulatory factor (Ser/Thr protein kinase)